jgi:aminomethyltransferase
MSSGDGKTRDLVASVPGAGWDHGISRHPYHAIEAPLGPRYTVYNRRLMACCFDRSSTEDGYWLLRQKAAVLHTGEFPLQFEGPDAERLLDLLFTRDITKLKPGRCTYGLACYEDGGLLVDGILLRLSADRFWYAQADGDFYSWARAHSAGMDVRITDPGIFVSQVQGPNALNVLEAASDNGLPERFTYFGIATVRLGGQQVVITRTGYTNELGWEFYTEPHHDAGALWGHLMRVGSPYGIGLHGLDAMNIRRIEAGILNAGSDFNRTTTAYQAGFGRFIDTDKGDFIGKAALAAAARGVRLTGVTCAGGQPLIGGAVLVDGVCAGRITAGAMSPYLGCGIGIALMDRPGHDFGTPVRVTCTDAETRSGELTEMPFYDKACEIPRGKLVDIPMRPNGA